MPDLREAIAEFSNEKLLDEYFNHKDEYTPEAITMIREEISRRGISEEQLTVYLGNESEKKIQELSFESTDFIQFDHAFSQTDILIAHAVLRENKIPFYVDNPVSNALPLENEAVKQFTIHVHKDFVESAHTLLDEHFEKSDGRYQLRYSGARERLLAFSFHDIQLSEIEAARELEVSFTDAERGVLIGYGKRLLDDVERIEAEQQRVVFYYDNVESLIAHLEDSQRTMFSRTDLLTILEILQIYCQDPGFPTDMDEAISTLLNVFVG